ncbi:MAG: hypothetical protein J6X28_00365 [Bacilli bacterium]|nr:hypothetical protein [Bacilli bacterium]
MAYYGITSASQLIDYETIRQGCVAYVSALEDFTTAAQQIVEAGTEMDKEALSVDNASMQPTLYELAELIGNIPNELAGYASEAYAAAVDVYNEQVAELNAYYQKLAEQQQQQQSGS